MVCAQSRPDAAGTHTETYPRLQKQIGSVVASWEMMGGCLRNPLHGESMAADDPRLIAMQAHATWERRGVGLEPGKQ